jgi:hypothetical protein
MLTKSICENTQTLSGEEQIPRLSSNAMATGALGRRACYKASLARWWAKFPATPEGKSRDITNSLGKEAEIRIAENTS